MANWADFAWLDTYLYLIEPFALVLNQTYVSRLGPDHHQACYRKISRCTPIFIVDTSLSNLETLLYSHSNRLQGDIPWLPFLLELHFVLWSKLKVTFCKLIYFIFFFFQERDEDDKKKRSLTDPDPVENVKQNGETSSDRKSRASSSSSSSSRRSESKRK